MTIAFEGEARYRKSASVVSSFFNPNPLVFVFTGLLKPQMTGVVKQNYHPGHSEINQDTITQHLYLFGERTIHSVNLLLKRLPASRRVSTKTTPMTPDKNPESATEGSFGTSNNQRNNLVKGKANSYVYTAIIVPTIMRRIAGITPV